MYSKKRMYSEALISFLNLDGKSGSDVKSPSCVHVASRTSEPTVTPMGISLDDTKWDPSDRQALTSGIKTALRRLHVNLGHPTNDDLTRCLAAGAPVAQRRVKCLRCSTCEKTSRSRSRGPSRIPTENASMKGCSWTCVTWWRCVETDVGS